MGKYLQKYSCGDVVTRYGRGQYLVLLINTKPEDCQEIQKRIDAQFREEKYRV